MPQVAVAAVFQVAGWAATALGASATGSLAVANAAVATATATAKVALMTGINKAIAHQNKPEPQGHMVNIAVSPDEPRRLMIGKRMTGGVLVDWYVRGSKNQNLYFVIYLGEGPMGRVTKLQAGGRTVYSNPINHGVRTVIPNFRSGGDRLWVTYYDGRPGQTADANLVSKGLGWSSSCRGTGMAYAVVEMQWDSDNLTSPVQLSFELEGAKLYDRRKDSTAGGAGSHRLTDPGTWELSSNPAVACDHYMLGRYVNGVKTFGIGIDPDDVPFDRFASLANLCDEAVSISGGGTQTRYESNGFLFADRSYKDTILDLCRSMNARPADFGGRISILDGQPRAPVLSIDDADMLEDSQEQYVPKRSWAALVSGVEGRFVPASQNYQPVDYARVADPSWAAEDAGQPKWATLDLEMETDHERAQRLAWLFAKRERRQAQLTGIYPLWTIELEQGDWFTRTGGKFGAGKVFEVLTRTLDPQSMAVTITAFEVDPSDSAWDNTVASGFVPDPVEGTGILPPLPQPEFSASPGGLSASDGSTIPGVGFTIVYDDDSFPVETQIEVARNDGTGAPDDDFEILTRTVPAGRSVQWFAGDLLPGTDYVYRGRSVIGERHGDWSDWQEFTTSEVFISQASYSAAPGGMLASTLAGLQTQVGGAQSQINTEQTARVAGDSSLSIAIDTVRASIIRPNLVSFEYQFMSATSPPALSFSYAAIMPSTSIENPYTGDQALVVEHTSGSKNANIVKFVGAGDAPKMRLAPARYAFRIGFRHDANYTGFLARLIDATGAVIASVGGFTGVQNTDREITGVFDLTANTTPVDASLQLVSLIPSKQVGSRLWIYATRIELAEDLVTEAGQLVRDEVTATAAVLKKAFIDENGNALAAVRLIADAGNGTPKTIELVDADGVAPIRLGGDTEVDGNLTVNGTLTAEKMVGNAITETPIPYTDDSVTAISANNNWEVMGAVTIDAQVGDTILVNSTAFLGADAIGFGDGFAFLFASARVRRGNHVIRQAAEYMEQSTAVIIDADFPPAGTHTYTLEVKYRIAGNGSTPGPRVSNKSLILTRTRR